MYTLADYAAGTKDVLTRGIINVILDDSVGSGGGLLRIMPVESVDALSWEVMKVNTEGLAASVGFRAINSNFPEGSIPTYQEKFSMSFVGGDVNYDIIFDRQKNYVPGAAPGVLQVKAKMQLINRLINYTLYAGDRAVDPNSFNGINKWVDSTQILQVTDFGGAYTNGLDVGTNFTVANGKYLVYLLNALIGMVPNPGAILMNWRMQMALKRVLLDSGYLKTTEDSYGRKFDAYDGIPIINPGSRTAVETIINGQNNTNAVIGNNLTFGSATNATAITVLELGEDGCALYENKPLSSRVVTEEDTRAPQKVLRVDWDVTFASMKKNAIAQLRGVIAA